MDSYEFARGVARIMDRENENGLSRIVEERRSRLNRITDPHRPYRTLVHILVDTLPPKLVKKFMPRGIVTVREAARILGDLADHTHLTPRGTPVVLDRDMHLFVRKSIFTYFLHLLTFDRYAQADEKPAVDDDAGEERVTVRFTPTGVQVSRGAILRWTAVIFDPERFALVADFLRTVDPAQYRVCYFRILEAAVKTSDPPDMDELRLILHRLRHPQPLN